jgi:multidrug efflux pump subunit AcrA (membrane-fusion protein)
MASESADRAANILVRSPRAARVVARLLLTLSGLMGLALFSPWQQSAPSMGKVVAFTPLERRQAIEAPIEGRVTRWAVQEGTRVEQGDILVELSDHDPEMSARASRPVSSRCAHAPMRSKTASSSSPRRG